MKSADIRAFLSCSFQDADRPVNDFVLAICQGLDIICTNVSHGFVDVPPERAKRLISEAHALIAVATRRDKVGSEFHMPAAVREEIAMAYGQGKPLLMLCEEGVRVDGFMSNYGTFLRFTRADLHGPDFIEKIVRSLHTLKLDVLPSHEILQGQRVRNHVAEDLRLLMSLEAAGSSFRWVHSVTRRIRFTEVLRSPIRTAWWANVPTKVMPGDPDVKMSVSVQSGSKAFVISPIVEGASPTHIEAALQVEPSPEVGDNLEYSTVFESTRMNPIFLDDILTPTGLTMGSKHFAAFDGIVLIHRTLQLKAQFRFARAYGLAKGELAVFVAGYSQGIDYLADDELKRCTVEVQSFGGEIVVDMSVDHPSLNLMYGIAWNPPAHGAGGVGS